MPCTIFTSDPFQDGAFISGEGSQTCSGDFVEQQISVVIQQYRSFGFWREKRRKTTAWTRQNFIRCSSVLGVPRLGEPAVPHYH